MTWFSMVEVVESTRYIRPRTCVNEGRCSISSQERKSLLGSDSNSRFNTWYKEHFDYCGQNSLDKDDTFVEELSLDTQI